MLNNLFFLNQQWIKSRPNNNQGGKNGNTKNKKAEAKAS